MVPVVLPILIYNRALSLHSAVYPPAFIENLVFENNLRKRIHTLNKDATFCTKYIYEILIHQYYISSIEHVHNIYGKNIFITTILQGVPDLN